MLSRRAMGRVLFVAALIALPLPWYLGEVERAPWLRLAFFTGIFGSVFVAEGATGTTRLFFGLGVAQLILYGAALRLAAALVARALAGLRSPTWRTAVVGSLAIVLLGAGFLPIYDTPLSSRRPHSSLLGIFD
ncbi:MAG TPA: hypothetical protein VNF72_08830 [Myxococcota bacterium]|nr:hypothetical protein [Myxococcota bacterium]